MNALDLSRNSPAHEQETPKPAPCFNLTALLQAVDNDPDFAVELLDMFLAQTPAEVQAMEQALETTDVATLSRIIHSQKASFQVFGLTEVVRLGQAAEALVAAGKTGMELTFLINRYLQTLKAEIPLIRTSLQSILNTQEYD